MLTTTKPWTCRDGRLDRINGPGHVIRLFAGGSPVELMSEPCWRRGGRECTVLFRIAGDRYQATLKHHLWTIATI